MSRPIRTRDTWWIVAASRTPARPRVRAAGAAWLLERLRPGDVLEGTVERVLPEGCVRLRLLDTCMVASCSPPVESFLLPREGERVTFTVETVSPLTVIRIREAGELEPSFHVLG